jgi:NodT family efflux transporter outer membrane factor (OMF) lipoprotein
MNGVGNFDTNLSPNIDKDQRIPVSPTTDVFVGLRSNWELDIWGKLKNLKQAALAEMLATRETRQFVATNLIAFITENYYRLLALDAEIEIVRKNIGLQYDGLEIVKAQKEGGRATELAVQQFAAQVLNTQAIEYNLLQERAAIENQLNAVAGRYPTQVFRDTALPDIAGTVRMTIGAPSSLLSRRPDIRQQEWLLQAAKENVAAARKAFLPSLVISPYIGLNAFTPGLLFKSGSGVYGLLGGLTAPVFQRRNLKAQYAFSNAENKEMVLRYQQKLLDAYMEVLTNMQAVGNRRKEYALKKKEVSQLGEAVITARELYLAGYANYLEVITAQKNVLEAELELISSRLEITTAIVRLYRSLGGEYAIRQ